MVLYKPSLAHYQITMNTTATRPFAMLHAIVTLLRPKHWVKNGFVFAPLIFSKTFTDPAAVEASMLACLLFCMASSAAYVFNDIRDRERDRNHPQKSRTRPLASGALSVGVAWRVLALLVLILLAGFFITPKVMAVIMAYLALNLAYSYALKHRPVVDLFCIALGFLLRVYAGMVVLAVPVSQWMLITTLCLALYLAAIKRLQELRLSNTGGREVLGVYSIGLLERYAELAATSAIVFYSLFIMQLHPEMAFTVPVVLFGVFRYWYITERLEGGESPTDVLFTDWPMILTVIVWVAGCAIALWMGY